MFIGATFLACDTQPTEAIDDPIGGTEVQLTGEPAPEVPEYDPAHLDEIAERSLDVLVQIVPRLDDREIDQLLSEEIPPREALEMSDSEFSALWQEIETLGMESEAIMANEDAWREVATVYKKNGVKCDKLFKFCMLPVLAAMFWGGPGPGTVYGATGGIYCYCSHCKGVKKLDKMCGKDDERPE